MLFLIPVFIGAFLLFQVQPFIAKIILPYFGGGAAVWTACLLFFQAFLLLGYLYAHVLSKLSAFKHQALIHSLVLVVSLLFLPIGVEHSVSDVAEQSPLFSILTLLMTSIGLPYLLLSATGPLVQRWFTLVNKDKEPYRLYSWSNLASLLALLSFPFVFEPMFSVASQSLFWSGGYLLYCILLITLIISVNKKLPTTLVDTALPTETTITRHGDTWLWLVLSILGVVMLVSTTNAMTQNIPPIPFLWILPLCLYLLSFIISFHSPKWYVKGYWFLLFVPTSLIAIFMFFIGSQFDITSQIILYSSILFSSCMICHGELAKLKPCPSRLTRYYLIIALGGFLGSALVAFVAQQIFTQFLEFPLAIIGIFITFAVATFYEHLQANKLVVASSLLAVVCMLALWQLNGQYLKTDVFNARNFYGVLSVKDVTINGVTERRLIDGTTSHGTQYLTEQGAKTPLSYYRKNTGVAIALEQYLPSQLLDTVNHSNVKPSQSLRVGLIGLGAGTLAAYGNKGDNYHFYELNPAVVNAAKTYFTYLRDSQANINISVGDGRVSLARELTNASQNNEQLFDILVIDAFSGDSIPQHLLTVEAMAIYWQRMTRNGVIVVHISNSNLNLLPLMQGLAHSENKQLRYFKTKANSAQGHDTEWVWITNNAALLTNSMVRIYQTPISLSASDEVVWTDNFSNLFMLLK